MFFFLVYRFSGLFGKEDIFVLDLIMGFCVGEVLVRVLFLFVIFWFELFDLFFFLLNIFSKGFYEDLDLEEIFVEVVLGLGILMSVSFWVFIIYCCVYGIVWKLCL